MKHRDPLRGSAQRVKRRRGRHATSRDQRFGRVLVWTTVGTLLPGAGLVAAGRRLAGAIVLGLFAALVSTAAALAQFTGLGLKVALRSEALLVAAWASGAVFILWALVILAEYLALRRPLRLSQTQRALGGVLAAALVAFAAVPTGLGAYYSLAQRSLLMNVFSNAAPRISDGPDLTGSDPWAGVDHLTVMLLGQDAGADRTGTRPDTIMVASIDTHTGRTQLINVPRNLAFPIFPDGTPLDRRFPRGFDAFGEQQSMINAVWTWGANHPDAVGDAVHDPGLAATTEAVEGSLGLTIDYYAMVNLQGFEDIVNAIGGVDIDVERRIPIGGGHTLSGIQNPVVGYIEPGPQHLDGYHALWYARSREGSDNYDRMCRQQRMVKTVLDEVSPLKLALAFPELAGSASRNVETDIHEDELDAFVELAQKVKGAGFTTVQIDNDVVKTWNPDYTKLHHYIHESLHRRTKKPVGSPEDATSTPRSTTPPATPSDQPTQGPRCDMSPN